MSALAEMLRGIASGKLPDDPARGCAVAADHIEAQAKEIAELRAALEWYADPQVYKPHPHGLAFDDRDLSWKARGVLQSR